MPGRHSRDSEFMNSKKILVVDDNVIVLKALSLRLSSAGYEVLLAEDGGTAATLVRQNKPDLILMDIRFPPDMNGGMDGFLILNWLRRMEEGKDTPVIMISQDFAEATQKRARESGVLAFCPKPLDVRELLRTIDHTLNTVGADGHVLQPGRSVDKVAQASWPAG